MRHIGYDARACWFIGCWLMVLGLPVAGSAPRVDNRRVAIQRGLNFIYTVASDDHNLDVYGGDLLWCFYSVWHTSSDRELAESAGHMGRERAQHWRKLHPHVPPEATADRIYKMVAAAYAADLLGAPDRGFKAELQQAASRFSARDFLGFDAPREAPAENEDRYDVWSGALITSYFGDAYGILLGAHHGDVMKWIPCLRPYTGHDGSVDFDAFYAVTHVIYTLNDYSDRRISASLLPDEFAYLRHKLTDALNDSDPEMVGEALDTLRVAGYENDPEVRKGVAYLIENQRPDGAWAGDQDDVYTEYHSAWTAIDGLRDYHFHGEVKRLPQTAAVRCK